jgi:hypothetical protein
MSFVDKESSVFNDPDLVNLELGGSNFKKCKKCYFKVSKKFEIIHACTYYLHTYLWKFSSQNTTVYGLHKKDKMKIYISLNSRYPIIIVFLTFFHFHIGHTQSYFFLENLHE